MTLEHAKNIMKKFTGSDIYEKSLTAIENGYIAITNKPGYKKLVCITEGSSSLAEALKVARQQNLEKMDCKLAELNSANAEVIRRFISWTAPSACGQSGMSIGLGDRLGLATPGHVRVVEGKDIKPVFAQQSVRECVLTNRTFRNVLDCATWGVLETGYQKGYGADGDHLKSEDEIAGVLALGFSMITLDCSEKIDKNINKMSLAEVEAKYNELPEAFRTTIEDNYLNKDFAIGEFKITYTAEQLKRIILTYAQAILFAKYIYHTYLQATPWPIDFELSIDETETITTPQDHFFVVNELYGQQVKLTSVAPRFCGEFQKAIDYIGDIAEFTEQLKVHVAIADKFGYRLSIHSGSDKLSVYPVIAELTKGRVHVKTAGTNWLEALRTIARIDKKFFREICSHARTAFDEASAYYHVTTDMNKVPLEKDLSDEQLEDMLNLPDARQNLHITYGVLLNIPEIKERIYKLLQENEETHYETVKAHINNHIHALGK